MHQRPTQNTSAILLALVLAAGASAAPERSAEVRVFEWTRAPAGVARKQLARSKVRVRDGAGQLRLSRGDENGPRERVEVRFTGLDQGETRVSVIDLSGATPPSPPVLYEPGASTLRVERTDHGYAVYAALPHFQDPADEPRAGSWEIELGPVPRPKRSLWGERLAVAPVDGVFSFLPPVH